jgi:hypothetical protein
VSWPNFEPNASRIWVYKVTAKEDWFPLEMSVSGSESSGRNMYEVIWRLKNYIFCDRMKCSPLSENRRFGGTRHVRLQVRRIIQERKQCEIRWKAKRRIAILVSYFEGLT